MCNEMLSLDYDMDNPNPSLFLGNVQWNLVRQYQNSYFPHCNCHYQLIQNFRNTSRNLFDMCKKVFSLNFDMGNQIHHYFYAMSKWKLFKQYKNSSYYVFLKYDKYFQESV